MAKQDGVVDGRKKSTIWNYFFLNVRFIISFINGILVIPLYLHYIDSSMYGAWLATGNILSWITIVDPGVGNVILQRIGFAIGKNDKDEIGLAITSGTIISLLLFIICVIAGFVVSFFISNIANIDLKYREDIVSAFRIGVIGTACSLLSNTFTNIVLAYQKTKLHGIFVNVIMLLSVVVTVILLFNNFGVYALAYNSLFTGAVTLAYSIVMTLILVKRHAVKLSFQMKYLKSFSQIFAYTFSSRLFDTLASNIDLILVSRYLGPNYVTALDLSRRPMKIITGIANNVSISMLPALSHLFGTGDKVRIREVTIRICSIVVWLSGMIICGFIIFNHSFVNNWVGDKFWVGTFNNNILCVSFFLLGIGYNLSNITHSMGDIKNNSLISVVRNVVYLVLLYLLAKTLGLTGVILAFGLPILILLWYFPRKLFDKAEYSKKDIQEILRETGLVSLIILACVIFTIVFSFTYSWFWLIVYAILFVLIYGILLIAFSKRFKAELGNISTMVTSKFNFFKLNH